MSLTIENIESIRFNYENKRGQLLAQRGKLQEEMTALSMEIETMNRLILQSEGTLLAITDLEQRMKIPAGKPVEPEQKNPAAADIATLEMEAQKNGKQESNKAK